MGFGLLGIGFGLFLNKEQGKLGILENSFFFFKLDLCFYWKLPKNSDDKKRGVGELWTCLMDCGFVGNSFEALASHCHEEH